MTSLPKEIYNELVDGLSLLVGARLAYAPQTEAKLDETLAAWEVVLASRGGWDAKLDKGRVLEAFLEMSATLDKFPPPKTLFDHLPPRPPPPPLPAPDAVPCPPEIAEILNGLTDKMKA